MVYIIVGILIALCGVVGCTLYIKHLNKSRGRLKDVEEQIERLESAKERKQEAYRREDNLVKEAEGRKTVLLKEIELLNDKKKTYNDDIKRLYDNYEDGKGVLRDSLLNVSAQYEKEQKERIIRAMVAADEKCAVIKASIDEVSALLVDRQEKLRLLLEEEAKSKTADAEHMMQVDEVSREEIEELYGLCKRFRNPMPLYKAVYETYFKVPYGNLVNGLNVRGVCGIYKITNMVNGLVYVGQSVDIGERWKQHIKRGCGAELGTISGSKLYGAMMNDGVWNFRFDVLMTCGKDELNKNEKFWIDQLSTVQFGYNMKAGG